MTRVLALIPGLLLLGCPACAAKAGETVGPDGTAQAHTTTTGLTVGSEAPAFSLPNADGETWSLADATARGPVLLVFYRGHWCPLCRQQMRRLEARREELEARGVAVVVVSADSPADSKAYAETRDLGFPMLADEDLETVRVYGVEHVGEDISLPATFVIEQGGRIRWLYVGNGRPGDRPVLDQTIAQLP